MKKFTRQEVDLAYRSLPPLVRDYMDASNEYVDVLVELGRQYKMHLDVLGVLSRLFRNMMYGLISAQELSQGLVEQGISNQDAMAIVSEINKKILMPLREKLRAEAERAKSGAQKTSATPPPQPPAMPKMMASYAPPPQSPSYVRPDVPAEPVLAPLPPKTIMPQAGAPLRERIESASMAAPSAFPPPPPAPISQVPVMPQEQGAANPQATVWGASMPEEMSRMQAPVAPQVPPPSMAEPVEIVRPTMPPSMPERSIMPPTPAVPPVATSPLRSASTIQPGQPTVSPAVPGSPDPYREPIE
jgi:hypothetical protein